MAGKPPARHNARILSGRRCPCSFGCRHETGSNDLSCELKRVCRTLFKSRPFDYLD
jgi:hypothetical protein